MHDGGCRFSTSKERKQSQLILFGGMVTGKKVHQTANFKEAIHSGSCEWLCSKDFWSVFVLRYSSENASKPLTVRKAQAKWIRVTTKEGTLRSSLLKWMLGWRVNLCSGMWFGASGEDLMLKTKSRDRNRTASSSTSRPGNRRVHSGKVLSTDFIHHSMFL